MCSNSSGFSFYLDFCRGTFPSYVKNDGSSESLIGKIADYIFTSLIEMKGNLKKIIILMTPRSFSDSC